MHTAPLPGSVGKVVDTIGAGDTFIAGFILGLKREIEMHDMCKRDKDGQSITQSSDDAGEDTGEELISALSETLSFAVTLASTKCGQVGFQDLCEKCPL